MRISDWSSDVCSSDLAVAVRREAQFLLFCRAVVVARRVEQRQHLAIGRDRGLIWIGARQARLLIAIARQRGERTRADIKVHVQIKAVDADAMALLHLEQVAVAVGDTCEIERITARRGSSTDAQRVEQLRSEEHTSELQSLMRISNPLFLVIGRTSGGERGCK